MSEFPRSVAAAKSLLASENAIGDALLEECGAPGAPGIWTIMEDVRRELLEVGFDYSNHELRKLHRAAYRRRFPQACD
jgi:hypothetical protein